MIRVAMRIQLGMPTHLKVDARNKQVGVVSFKYRNIININSLPEMRRE